MKEFVEKIIDKLEDRIRLHNEKAQGYANSALPTLAIDTLGKREEVEEIKKIINQLAEEYSNGWIPCSERLPEETECYLVTWRDRVTCKNYVEIIEYDAEGSWLDCICQAGLLGYDIIAWQPLPTSYVQK